MSESEFDEILRNFSKKPEKNDFLEPPFVSSRNINHSKPTHSSNKKPPKKNKKGIVIAVILVVIIAVAGLCTSLALSGGKKENAEEIVENALPVNVLTGESEYNQNAVGKRPVAVVVENEYSTEAVRPQWNIDDADIVLEGESEYSTRLLLFWADYSSVPDMVGPVRSARPPFIRFSQLFDSVFIHAGLSKTKGAYIGADTVFDEEDVDHINLLNCAEDGKYFGRNNERYTSSEHTGYLNGSNLSELIAEKDINTKLDNSKFTAFSFNEEAQAIGDITALNCSFKFSEGHCPKTAKFSYDASKHKYVTADFDSQYGESNVAFENLIFIFDETEYIVKEDYKNGQSETYCDYKLTGGDAVIVSEGTAVKATWGIADGKLWLKSADGSDISLNVGKTYIGYGSSNNGGSLEFFVQDTSDN